MHPDSDDTAPGREMPRYQSHKKVWALKIASVEWLVMTFAEEGYAPLKVEPMLFARYAPVPGDYYVVYDDGYRSIAPAKAFEEGYTRL